MHKNLSMKYEIEIIDTIGYWECSSYYIKKKLDEYKGKPVNMKISSPGGDVWEGLKIYQLIKDHGDVTVYLSGIVASAATFLSLGAKKIVIHKNTLYMIHNSMSWIDTWGYMNKEEIKRCIKDLEHTFEKNEKIDHLIASMYAERSGKEISAFKESMTKETWMLPNEVKEMGLADEISEEKSAAINAKMVARLDASGLPKLPEGTEIDMEDEEKPGLIQRFAAEIARVMNPNPVVPVVTDENNIKNKTIMNKNFSSIMTLLLLESIACTNDKFELTATQMEAIDKALAENAALKNAQKTADQAKADAVAAKETAESAKATAEQKVAELQKQLDDKNAEIAALKKNAPEPRRVNNQGDGGDDNDAPLEDQAALDLAYEYMGMKTK